jgi:hypothetical protein
VGRELGGATVGLVGMTPAAQAAGAAAGAFGARCWATTPRARHRRRLGALGRRAVCLRELMQPATRVRAADLLQRYQGPARRALPDGCKPNQVLVSLAHSSLFDERRWPMRWPGPHGRGLVRQPGARRAGPGPAAAPHRHLQVTPRVAAPRANRACAAPGPWPAHRRAAAGTAPARADFRPTRPDEPLVLQAGQRLLKSARRSRSCATTAAGARATKLSLPSLASALAISPCRRAISLPRRARSAATSICTCSASRRSPTPPPARPAWRRRRRLRRRARARRPAGQGLQQRRAASTKAASPSVSSGTRSPGDRPISLRRRRHLGDHAFSRAIQASAAGSTFSSCACG